MKIAVLGGGLSGISLAYFLQNNQQIDQIDIFEKEENLGGLARSFKFGEIYHDIGPHILFSKDKEILELIIKLLGENKNKLYRSNKIIYKNKFVKYPFENELSALPKKDKDYCLNTFLNNAYENYETSNMLQFFLKNFGEGITNSYLRPYNEKIWKFDPSFMDTQMVERIPKPPKEDIIKGANGMPTEGYLHQLHFYYPSKGGINSLIRSFIEKFENKVRIFTKNEVNEVSKTEDKWEIKANNKVFGKYDTIISTIPIHELTNIYRNNIPKIIIEAVNNLKFNSIIIANLNVKKDNIGDNFALMIPDKNIIFHRVSKLNFLGNNYIPKDNSTSLMIEITYKKDDLIDKSNDDKIIKKIIKDLEKIQLIDNGKDVNFVDIKRFKYAYVIYDLNHRKNIDLARSFFSEQGIELSGRFGEFEYLNMDAVIKHSKKLSEKL